MTKTYEEVMKDKPTLEGNKIIVRKDLETFEVKVDENGRFKYYRVKE